MQSNKHTECKVVINRINSEGGYEYAKIYTVLP